MAKLEGKQNAFAQNTLGGFKMQYAALCWRMHGNKIEVLLITSRDTGRWVIPKGWPMENLSPEAAAAQEAWEEAGVEGKIDPVCVGLFAYDKLMAEKAALPCAVSVYALRVDRLADEFPERRLRRRKWFPLDKAVTKVNEPELRCLLAGFVPTTARQSSPICADDDLIIESDLPPGQTPPQDDALTSQQPQA